MKALWLGLGLVLGAAQAVAQPGLPQPGVPESFGVAVHLGHVEAGDWQRMAETGFRWVRLDLPWAKTEPRRGQYAWGRYDAALAAMQQHGLRPIFILAYGNPLYQEGPPTTPAARAAYARWAAEAVRHFQTVNPVWELWNEPELATFWPPKPHVEAYLALAGQACHAMRQADPHALIVGGASAYVPTKSNPKAPFLRAVLASPAVGCFSAVSVHPYNIEQANLEDVAWTWASLRRVANSFQKRDVPFVSTEWGFSAMPQSGKSLQGIEATHAALMVKIQLLNVASHVPLSVLYDWKDNGADPTEKEHHFGLVRQDGTPKPAQKALQNMLQQLKGLNFVCQKSDAMGQTVLFEGEGETRAVSWPRASLQMATFTLLPSANPVDTLGRPLTPNEAGQIEVEGLFYWTPSSRPCTPAFK